MAFSGPHMLLIQNVLASSQPLFGLKKGSAHSIQKMLNSAILPILESNNSIVLPLLLDCQCNVFKYRACKKAHPGTWDVILIPAILLGLSVKVYNYIISGTIALQSVR